MIIAMWLPFTAGEFEDPVLKKVFTEYSHIVAVKPTGNVFTYEVSRRAQRSPCEIYFVRKTELARDLWPAFCGTSWLPTSVCNHKSAGVKRYQNLDGWPS